MTEGYINQILCNTYQIHFKSASYLHTTFYIWGATVCGEELHGTSSITKHMKHNSVYQCWIGLNTVSNCSNKKEYNTYKRNGICFWDNPSVAIYVSKWYKLLNGKWSNQVWYKIILLHLLTLPPLLSPVMLGEGQGKDLCSLLVNSKGIVGQDCLWEEAAASRKQALWAEGIRTSLTVKRGWL